MNKIVSETKIAVHPGYFLCELQEDYGLSLSEFSDVLDIRMEILVDLLHGDIAMTEDFAKKIASFSGSSAELWLRLQNKFDIVKNEIEREKDLLSLVEEEVEQNTKIG